MFLGEVFFLFLGYLSMYGAMQYYYTYIVGDVSGMSLALTLLTLLAIPTMILAAYLNGKGIAKIKLIQFGAIVDCVGFAILFFTSNGTIATASLGLIGLGFGFRSSMFFSMMPDIFDYTEWQVGRNLGGTQNAIQGFVNKVSSAAASAIVSAFLYGVTTMQQSLIRQWQMVSALQRSSRRHIQRSILHSVVLRW